MLVFPLSFVHQQELCFLVREELLQYIGMCKVVDQFRYTSVSNKFR